MPPIKERLNGLADNNILKRKVSFDGAYYAQDIGKRGHGCGYYDRKHEACFGERPLTLWLLVFLEEESAGSFQCGRVRGYYKFQRIHAGRRPPAAACKSFTSGRDPHSTPQPLKKASFDCNPTLLPMEGVFTRQDHGSLYLIKKPILFSRKKSSHTAAHGLSGTWDDLAKWQVSALKSHRLMVRAGPSYPKFCN
jgi:hypothetical protein